ncbi:MAG: hypothetical protein ACN6PF_23985 [Achromobacter veterisilvae]
MPLLVGILALAFAIALIHWLFANALMGAGTVLLLSLLPISWALKKRFSLAEIRSNPKVRVPLVIYFAVSFGLFGFGYMQKKNSDAQQVAIVAQSAAAEKTKQEALRKSNAMMFAVETDIVKLKALKYKDRIFWIDQGTKDCRDAIDKADYSEASGQRLFMMWHHAWGVCASYARELDQFSPLGEYMKIRPNLVELLKF